MTKGSRIFLWIWMLSKRLYKKLTFLLILALIPSLVLGYTLVDKEDSGMLTISLACEDTLDPVAADMIQQLLGSSQLIRFVHYASAPEAEDSVKSGSSDAAWIFMDDLENRIRSFAESHSGRDAFIRVIQREQTVPLMLTREKLSGIVYEKCAKPFYLQYLRSFVPEFAAVSDEELLFYFDQVNMSGNLFEFADLNGAVGQQNEDAASYLVTPIRGLLAVVVALSGLATAMYYYRDERAGRFSWVPQRNRCFVEMGYQMISLLHVLLAVMVALLLSGLHVSVGREVLVCGVFLLCCAGLSMAMRMLCGNIRVLGVAIPLMTVAMIAVCPVFYDFGMLRSFQLLFPPTYFINGAFNEKYLIWGLIYSCIMFGIFFFAGKLSKKL